MADRILDVNITMNFYTWVMEARIIDIFSSSIRPSKAVPILSSKVLFASCNAESSPISSFSN